MLAYTTVTKRHAPCLACHMFIGCACQKGGYLCCDWLFTTFLNKEYMALFLLSIEGVCATSNLHILLAVYSAPAFCARGVAFLHQVHV